MHLTRADRLHRIRYRRDRWKKGPDSRIECVISMSRKIVKRRVGERSRGLSVRVFAPSKPPTQARIPIWSSRALPSTVKCACA